MSQSVVVDASLAAMWVLPETHSQQALALADYWGRQDISLVAPSLFLAEVTNALYKRVRRKEFTLLHAQEALQVIFGFSLDLVEEPGLGEEAMTLAHQLRQPTTYDCHYLALAQRYNCEFWTGDQKFCRAVQVHTTLVRWVGAYSPIT